MNISPSGPSSLYEPGDIIVQSQPLSHTEKIDWWVKCCVHPVLDSKCNLLLRLWLTNCCVVPTTIDLQVKLCSSVLTFKIDYIFNKQLINGHCHPMPLMPLMCRLCHNWYADVHRLKFWGISICSMILIKVTKAQKMKTQCVDVQWTGPSDKPETWLGLPSFLGLEVGIGACGHYWNSRSCARRAWPVR